jgi:site-specific recombinase XerD
MLPQCSHITRKRGVYAYRRRLPYPYKGEVAVSLGTRLFRAAEAAAAALDHAFAEFFTTPPMTEFDLRAALQAYLRQHLAALRTKHLETPYGKPVHVSDINGFGSALDADLAAVDHQLRQFRSDLRRRDGRSVQPFADRLMVGFDVPPVRRTEFTLGLLQAHIQLLEQSRTWLTTGLVEEITLAAPSPRVDAVVEEPTKAAARPEQLNHGQGALFSEVLPPFIAFMATHQGWRGQTLAQNQATYRMFQECCGDRPIEAYQRRDLAAFYDLLRALPALYSKRREWHGLPLKEIAERTKDMDVERLTMKTIKRHFAGLGKLFTYLKKRGEYEGENPAHGFEFPKKGRANAKRQKWDDERLGKLFASPIWTGCRSEARRSTPGSLIIRDVYFWLPLLGAYHGNRLEEFAQLTRADVRNEEGIWYFDINDDDAKQLKNEQSKRRVPIHPFILQIGFLAYVEATAPSPTDRIFPTLRPGGPDKKLGYFFTKWWTRYRRDIGIYEKGLDYHSFRHAVTTQLAARRVSLEFRNELLGHEGNSTDERVYLKGLPLPLLSEAISMIAWPTISATLAPN